MSALFLFFVNRKNKKVMIEILSDIALSHVGGDVPSDTEAIRERDPQ